VLGGAISLSQPTLDDAMAGELPPIYVGRAAFGCAWFGRSALRLRWPNWVRLHIAAMSLSYVVMLIAFYVDNGKQLPIWKDLPHFLYWLLPPAVAAPLIVWALLYHPLVSALRSRASQSS
jgi:hypothetical protein